MYVRARVFYIFILLVFRTGSLQNVFLGLHCASTLNTPLARSSSIQSFFQDHGYYFWLKFWSLKFLLDMRTLSLRFSLCRLFHRSWAFLAKKIYADFKFSTDYSIRTTIFSGVVRIRIWSLVGSILRLICKATQRKYDPLIPLDSYKFWAQN